MASDLPSFPNFRRIATPNPNQWAVLAAVPDDDMTLADFPNILIPADQDANGNTTIGSPAVPATLYGNFSRAYANRIQDYGNFVYSGQAPAPSGFLGFFFAPPTSTPPKPFRTFPEQGNHHWPAVLKRIDWYPDQQFPIASQSTDGTHLGVIFGRRYYERRYYIPDTNEGTLFTTEEFIGSAPFPITQYPTPVPTEISWDFLGQKGHIPECLHADVIIEAKQSGLNSFYSTGVVSSASIASEQFFPKTNFTDWGRYCLSDKQNFTDGVWYRTRIWVSPPPQPKVIKQ